MTLPSSVIYAPFSLTDMQTDTGDTSISSVEAFHASLSAWLAKDTEGTMSKTCGRKRLKLSEESSQWLVSSKMFPDYSVADILDSSSTTCMAQGTMLNGELYLLPMSVLGTCEIGSGFLPTSAQANTPMFPTVTRNDSKNNAPPAMQTRNTIPLNALFGRNLNPAWVEWLMGWPVGAPSLETLQTDAALPLHQEAEVSRVLHANDRSRAHRISLLGNGQVPQCAEAAFRLMYINLEASV